VGDNDAVTTPTPAPTRGAKADALLMGAVDEARAALVSTVPAAEVGDHLGAVAEDERVVTHYFATTDRGYVGWRWAVTITRAARQKTVTLNEIVLLPSETAVQAPEWIPWKDRMAPGDLGPGDLVPVPVDDPRLVPGYLVGDEALDAASAREQREVIREVGLGRDVVLSIEGRDEAADRWYEGPHGPHDPIAKVAPGNCGSCGFLIRLAGPMTSRFGVCANVSSPSDGHAVSFDHGCGAHSDVRDEPSQHQPAAAAPYHDTLTFDTLTFETWGDADLEIIR
jgi:DUF3027 family protein